MGNLWQRMEYRQVSNGPVVFFVVFLFFSIPPSPALPPPAKKPGDNSLIVLRCFQLIANDNSSRGNDTFLLADNVTLENTTSLYNENRRSPVTEYWK